MMTSPTSSKYMQFFDTAIEKTKKEELVWKQVTTSDVREFIDVDIERSFIAKHGEGLIFLLRDIQDDSINCWIKPGPKLIPRQVGPDNLPILLRLYNIVYEKFPSVDKFIDDFIAGF